MNPLVVRRERIPLNDAESFPIVAAMEKLIEEVTAYAKAKGRTPQAVLRDAIGAGWREWDSWCAGASSPTLARVDRLRKFMSEHPAPPQEDAA